MTNLGPVDVVLDPKGYERGYDAVAQDATTVWRGDVEIRVGALADLVHCKELLRRDKDVEHLALLYKQRPELARSTPSIDVEDGWTSTRRQRWPFDADGGGRRFRPRRRF